MCPGFASQWRQRWGHSGRGSLVPEESRALCHREEGDLALLILPQVSDATGQMNLTKVADSSPFAVELLIPDDCFVLDNGLCGKIYIWKGTCGFSSPA